MKAFLLAAGHGTRLRPLTDSIPKCLVPVRGVPILRIWFDLCAMHGITDVLINVHSHAEAVRDFIDSQKLRVNVVLSEETDLLGSAGTLRANREWVKSETEFWILYADVLTCVDMSAMLRFHSRHKLKATIAVSEVAEPTRCGIVRADQSGVVRSFVEKPSRPESNLAFSGLMLAHPDILDLVPLQRTSDIGYDVLPQLVDKMAAFPIDGFLLDVGTLKNYELAQQTWPGLPKVTDTC
jgi:mannose-1-phosphate guanylyltransferase